MNHIVTVQDAVTAFANFMEPTDAELDAIEQEMPVILADVDLLDAQIVTRHRPEPERRARRGEGGDHADGHEDGAAAGVRRRGARRRVDGRP
ncbi:DUF6284 family protein [Streptomyces sp. NRRL F-5555]|uniref:DUF6284 family protein n=1 Tax=Streptomyces sp. NRRL F-5555 TaxID=1463863 RepID=UPI000A77C56C|nr:DUF6284 family protein [Streptomyces sp. NRRL F-5555]